MLRQTLCKVAIGIGVSNYALYVLASVAAGGDALQGHIAQGHYFAAAGSGFVEVGRLLFQFCRWQAYSLLVTFPLLLWGGFCLTPVSQVRMSIFIHEDPDDACIPSHAP